MFENLYFCNIKIQSFFIYPPPLQWLWMDWWDWRCWGSRRSFAVTSPPGSSPPGAGFSEDKMWLTVEPLCWDRFTVSVDWSEHCSAPMGQDVPFLQAERWSPGPVCPDHCNIATSWPQTRSQSWGSRPSSAAASQSQVLLFLLQLDIWTIKSGELWGEQTTLQPIISCYNKYFSNLYFKFSK